MITKIRENFGLVCLACFTMTTGAGVAALLMPGPIFYLAGFDITPATLFFHRFAFLLVAIVGLWYLIIMTNPEAYRLLIALAVFEKFAFVSFFIYLMMKRQLSLLFLPVAFGDFAMGAACLVYLIFGGTGSAGRRLRPDNQGGLT